MPFEGPETDAVNPSHINDADLQEVIKQMNEKDDEESREILIGSEQIPILVERLNEYIDENNLTTSEEDRKTISQEMSRMLEESADAKEEAGKINIDGVIDERGIAHSN